MNKMYFREQWDFHYNVNLIYTENNEFVGKGIIRVSEDEVNINSIYVNEKYRGKGISKQILSDLINYNDKWLHSDLTIVVRRDNFISKMYKKLGFVKFDEYGIYDSLKLKK